MDLSLTIPEILICIFEFLEEHPYTLAVASQVNRQWFTCGTDVLWREAPCGVLANVTESRRQVYASKITSLAFSGDDEAAYHSSFKHLRFTKLRRISLDAYHPGEGNQYHIRHYFQPPLQEFSFYGGELDDELLVYLRTTCWRLRKILLDSPGRTITPLSFLDFISGCKSVEHVEFLHGMDHLLTDELLLHLASQPHLSGMAIGKICSQRVIEHISTDIPEPFAALRILHIAIPSSALPFLVPAIKTVTNLHLTIQDANDQIIRQLSSLPALRVLSLYFAVATELLTAEILSLTSHTKLERLTIGPVETEDAGDITTFNFSFSDSDFEFLCSKLHDLRSISFQVQCNLSAAVLESLSRHCPLLEECVMPQTFDFRALNLDTRNNAMFPNLRSLDFAGFQQPTVDDLEVVG